MTAHLNMQGLNCGTSYWETYVMCDEHVPYVFENALETNKNAKKRKIKIEK